jgi:copper resistance protein C
MTPPSRAVRRGGLAGIASAVLGLALGAVPAAAHTELIASSPADKAVLDTAPAVVVLEFNQPLQTDFGQVAVLDATGAHHELGEPEVVGRTVTQALGALNAGAYEISYRVGSADGHPVTGTVRFTVAGAGSTPEATPEVSSGSVAPSPSSSDPHEGVDHDDHASPTAEPVDTTDAGGTSPLLLGAGGVAAAAVLAAVVYFAMGGRGRREAGVGEESETGS